MLNVNKISPDVCWNSLVAKVRSVLLTENLQSLCMDMFANEKYLTNLWMNGGDKWIIRENWDSFSEMGVWNEEWIKSCNFHVTLPTDRVAESTTGHCLSPPRDLLFQGNSTPTPMNLITMTSTRQIAADGGSNTTEAGHQRTKAFGCFPILEYTKPPSRTAATHRNYDSPTQHVISSVSKADPAQYLEAREVLGMRSKGFGFFPILEYTEPPSRTAATHRNYDSPTQHVISSASKADPAQNLEASEVLGTETLVSRPTRIPIILAGTRHSSAECEPSAVFPEASFLDNADMDPVREWQENADLADSSNFPRVRTERTRGRHPHDWTGPIFDTVHSRPVGLTIRRVWEDSNSSMTYASFKHVYRLERKKREGLGTIEAQSTWSQYIHDWTGSIFDTVHNRPDGTTISQMWEKLKSPMTETAFAKAYDYQRKKRLEDRSTFKSPKRVSRRRVRMCEGG